MSFVILGVETNRTPPPNIQLNESGTKYEQGPDLFFYPMRSDLKSHYGNIGTVEWPLIHAFAVQSTHGLVYTPH